MALAHSPKIVTDGLVLSLDALDLKSYSGSGSTWYDRSGNAHNGSKVSAPAFSSDNGGVFVFDGTDDGFSFSSVPQVFDGSVTFEGWFYFEDSGIEAVVTTTGVRFQHQLLVLISVGYLFLMVLMMDFL